MKLNFTPTKGAAMVRHINKESSHPYNTLVIRVNQVSKSHKLGRRIVMVEQSCEVKVQNVWKIFTRLAPMASTEEELIEAMDWEIPGLGQVAKVFGTYEGPEGREEDVWTILEFFMNVHVGLQQSQRLVGLQQSPRLAWRDQKLRKEVLRLATIYGSIGSI